MSWFDLSMSLCDAVQSPTIVLIGVLLLIAVGIFIGLHLSQWLSTPSLDEEAGDTHAQFPPRYDETKTVRRVRAGPALKPSFDSRAACTHRGHFSMDPQRAREVAAQHGPQPPADNT